MYLKLNKRIIREANFVDIEAYIIVTIQIFL